MSWVHEKTKDNYIMHAIKLGHYDCVESLIRANCDPNAENARGMTCLMYVIVFFVKHVLLFIFDSKQNDIGRYRVWGGGKFAYRFYLSL